MHDGTTRGLRVETGTGTRRLRVSGCGPCTARRTPVRGCCRYATANLIQSRDGVDPTGSALLPRLRSRVKGGMRPYAWVGRFPTARPGRARTTATAAVSRRARPCWSCFCASRFASNSSGRSERCPFMRTRTLLVPARGSVRGSARGASSSAAGWTRAALR
jgi:hypothetical protein